MPPEAPDQSLPRRFRLKRQRLIRPLFAPDRSDVNQVRVGPVVVRSRRAPHTEAGFAVPVQVGFAVSRRIGDHPARNRVRRILRETFRLHRHELEQLLAGRPDVLTLMILYRGRYAEAASAIPRALPAALRRVAGPLAPSNHGEA